MERTKTMQPMSKTMQTESKEKMIPKEVAYHYCWCGRKEIPTDCSRKYNHDGKCPSCFGKKQHEKKCPYFKNSSPSTMENWDKCKAELETWMTSKFGCGISYSNIEYLRELFDRARASRNQELIRLVEEGMGNACSSNLCGHRNLDPNSVNHGEYIGRNQALQDLLALLKHENK